MKSSSASAQWLEATTTASADGAQQQLGVQAEGEALAPSSPPEPSNRMTSTRTRREPDAREHGALHTMPRRVAAHPANARPLAEWQGYVTKIDGDRFQAVMEGVFGVGVVGKMHEANIPMREVAPHDLSLVREGAYFRLSIAYAITQPFGGTFSRTSTLVFRRLPAYHAADLDQAREIARQLLGPIRLG